MNLKRKKESKYVCYKYEKRLTLVKHKLDTSWTEYLRCET